MQVLAAVDSVAGQLRARELAMIDSLQRYGYRVFTEIMTPAQVWHCVSGALQGKMCRDGEQRNNYAC